ncbi:MAG: DUF2238 domain-containing protein [Deltaproteobacteria bacterium]|nr:DUF2238 domain-containing protein [Deltaproteobacteria bacterium]
MISNRSRYLVAGSILLIAFLAVSGLDPYDRLTWAMEVAPVVIVLPILWTTYRRFPLTHLLYAGIFFHALVLMVGGFFTYARVPLGFEVQDLLGLQRNPYDKLGHLLQGFVPALAAREILIRGGYVRKSKMLFFIVVCIVLGISAGYEFLEWGAAVALGQGAEEFLGTQGDPWDTQSDMFCALLGALAALFFFSGLQDRQMRALESYSGGGSSPGKQSGVRMGCHSGGG